MHYETLNEGLALRQRADLLYRLIFRLTNLAFLRARAISRENIQFCFILHCKWRLATASLLIRDPTRGTSQLYLRVACTSAFKQFFLVYYSYRKRARRLPLRRENLATNFVNIHILVLVYVEYCQRGRALLTHSASKRGFQSPHAAKTAFGSAGWHRRG